MSDSYPHDDIDPSQPASAQDVSTADPKLPPQSLPMQKRRRVGRACDECRRKKIKCDGKQPCTHCTVYSYGANFARPPKILVSTPSHVANIR